jgi:hypothetical protein
MLRLRTMAAVTCPGVLLLVLLLCPMGGVAAASSCSWKVSPAIAPKGLSELYGVDARTSRDVWAVGSTRPPQSASDAQGPTIALHWNGVGWRSVPTPKGNGLLLAVAAVAQRDAWAVGARGTRALIEHWDGTRWRIFPSPDIGMSVLKDIDAASSDDAWAVGSRGSAGRSLIEHWNGRKWQVVAGADEKPELELRRVSVTPSGAVWAAGETDYLRGPRCVEHWEGASWRFAPLPAGADCFVSALDALSARDVWVETFANGHRVLRSDGMHWHSTGRLSDLTADCCGLSAISAISDRDIWAAGTAGDLSHGLNRVYIAHWDGSHWLSMHAPFDRYGSGSAISDISAVSAHEVWAVGYKGDSALLERYACSG